MHSFGKTSASVTDHPPRRQPDVGHEEIKDHDPTPRAQHEPWRFTPSLLDPNSFSFTNFANQTPGYYTPTPGGTNTFYHNQAGDLHTPGMGLGMGLGTPLSMPTSEGTLHPGAMLDLNAFGSAMQQPHFQNYNPFAQHDQQPHQQTQQQSYAPSSFVHQDTGYETMETDGSPMDEDGCLASIDSTMQQQSPVMSYHQRPQDMSMVPPPPFSSEKFRWQITLNAPTAMVKHAEEIPITYLNKGQAYSISIVDSNPSVPLPPGTKYRTFVRISFEDEQQRQRAGYCWQLWKEGRGSHEAHQRGGKLQAVEYVEANQLGDSEDKKTRVELDTASFDGFSVTWTPGPNGSAECNVAVRFNFLSTDFSHSKGVKGIPVRLCAKTELLSTGSPRSTSIDAELAFCKVKLFRDHGAERKLSNDVAHVKKTIDKLKQQIAQAETGMKDFGKRKRSGSISKAQPSQRPGKVQKHKRTWSMSSASSAGGRPPVEEDLVYKLQTMQDMFTSTRAYSLLCLRGDEQDDPDLHPVTLAGEPLDLTKVDASVAWQPRSGSIANTADSSILSPSPSSISLASQAQVPASTGNPQWQELQATQIQGPTRIAKRDESGNLSGWIEALGVDASYKPPVVRPIKPVACFYILNRADASEGQTGYYRAVYLMQRTLKDFTDAIATKWGIEPTMVLRTLHVLQQGLEVEVDDDVIRELAEGQDMVMDISKISKPEADLKREWDMAVDVMVDSESAGPPQHVVHKEGFEIRLIF